MHNCPRCYQACYCSGDIDDIPVMKESWVARNCKCNCEGFLEEEEDFEHCSECDLPDACSDFGCAADQGLKKILTSFKLP